MSCDTGNRGPCRCNGMARALSKRERDDLQAIVRRRRGEARFHRRARMVLLAAEGESISAMARNLGTCRALVGQWLRHFGERRLERLEDLSRSGRPPEITALERHQVIATACRSPADFGFPRVLWDHATLAIAVMSAGLVRSISSRTVGRILENAEIKPHRVKMWCHSDDPAYYSDTDHLNRYYSDCLRIRDDETTDVFTCYVSE